MSGVAPLDRQSIEPVLDLGNDRAELARRFFVAARGAGVLRICGVGGIGGIELREPVDLLGQVVEALIERREVLLGNRLGASDPVYGRRGFRTGAVIGRFRRMPAVVASGVLVAVRSDALAAIVMLFYVPMTVEPGVAMLHGEAVRIRMPFFVPMAGGPGVPIPHGKAVRNQDGGSSCR